MFLRAALDILNSIFQRDPIGGMIEFYFFFPLLEFALSRRLGKGLVIFVTRIHD